MFSTRVATFLTTCSSLVLDVSAVCTAVKGRITSSVADCQSATAQSCTQGKFNGGLNGDFYFKATGMVPLPGLENLSGLFAATGEIDMTLTNNNLCPQGTILHLDDASSFVPSFNVGDSYLEVFKRFKLVMLLLLVLVEDTLQQVVFSTMVAPIVFTTV